MDGRIKRLVGCLTSIRAARGSGHLLLVLTILAGTLLASRPAAAQAPRIAISEIGYELAGSDRAREYLEIANLGETAWDPNNHWVLRIAAEAPTPEMYIRIQGVDPVPPGQVLLIEWGRPNPDDGENAVACVTGGNVFCTGLTDEFGSHDMFREMALAVLAPTPNNEAPAFGEGTMLAYFFQGDLENISREDYLYDKSVAAKLWNEDGAAPYGASLENWVNALRMAPGPYPPEHGRSAADYYATLAGHPSLNNRGLEPARPLAAAPNTMNRAGTPGRPNYLHPGVPIPGQIAAHFYAIRAGAAAASLVPDAPATGLQVVGLSAEGNVATSLSTNNTWGAWTPVAGAPAADAVVLLDNPKTASRALIMRARGDGALSISRQTGDREQSFSAPEPLEIKAQGIPAATVDPATGNEHYVAVEMGTGAIMHNVNEGGKLRGWQPIASVTTNAWVGAHWSTDPAGLSVVAWNENQLVLNRMGADGKFGAWQNVGEAVSARPAGIGPVLTWNPQAKRLEIVALTGPAEYADVQHARVELTATEVKPGALAKVSDIRTNAPVTVAVDPQSGAVRLLARSGGKEPGINPRTDAGADPDPGDPRSGFVLESTFDGNTWSASRRVGTGRLPGPAAMTPLFTTPVPPVTVFDANTRRFNDFLIGEDAQIYHNAPSQ